MGKNKQSKGPDNVTANGKSNGEINTNVPSEATPGITNLNGNAPSTNGRGASSMGGEDNTRSRDSGFKEPPSPTRTVRWPDFQSSDLEVMVAGTTVFRLHQEIMAAHSKFFQEQLQLTIDSQGLVIAPRSKDVPVIVLRDICVDAFVNVLSLVYPPLASEIHHSSSRRITTDGTCTRMPGVIRSAIDILIQDPNTTPFYSTKSPRGTCSDYNSKLSEACTALVPERRRRTSARGSADGPNRSVERVLARRIFARFEPCGQRCQRPGAKPHRAGDESELVQWSGYKSSESAGARPELGRCQQVILEALKAVFNVDGPKSDFDEHVIQAEASVMWNLTEWLR
ncbi:The BTB (BR-C, ttk and bab)/POZ (Pox virus and Zinc finger) domain [Rhizoctonia solani]|uniref:The BTB (BR-C, ttk and bab)/POZ (Pox virus and Zinc finger) domain n=1 Tax=Rhizoctonia solani TaxID=456999 RepID=A0A8H8P3C4_9AGAM|nr:The BTB (BR-C, ttk and bab)/POZ (Pox virus and Zinc finger) domain [Rhizoctonia solani]QRW23898.1 The BTB (BR-C, ttk and bab)/POZ (Pox virus and Zinc finger) domain [Rhizoctonia solani]